MEFVLDILADAAGDTLALVPFLLVTYLVLELLEHVAGDRVNAAIQRAGAAGPVVGAVLGVVPQCGFSAMAATLYAGRIVTLGTLVAVFLSTSDEMLPMLVAESVPVAQMAQILAVKALIAVVTGFVIDGGIRALRRNTRVHAVLRRTVLGASANPAHVNCGHDDHSEGDILDEIGEAGVSAEHIHELCERAHCGCEEDEELGPVGGHGHGLTDGHGHGGCHGLGEHGDGCEDGHETGYEDPYCHDGAHAEFGCEHVVACCCGSEGAAVSEHGHSHGCEHECGHGHVHEQEHSHGHDHGHGHSHDHAHAHGGSLALSVVRSAVVHTAQVTVFIFLVTVVLVAVLETVGEPALEQFLRGNETLAILGSALVGLIPNCSASVVITQLYLEGALPFAPMLAGTLISAGVGYLVLFRTNRSARENLVFLVLMYLIGITWGLILAAFGL